LKDGTRTACSIFRRQRVPDMKSVDINDNEKHLKKIESDTFLAGLYEIHGDKFIRYRRDWERTCRQEFVPDFPLHLELEINNYCNLKCAMCHFAKYYHNPQKKKNMDLEMLDLILNQCRGRLPAVLIGSGAESFLHPQINEIIQKFHDAGIMDIIVSTNGIMLTETMIELLVRLNIPRITVSVDAVSQETYAKIRGGRLSIIEKNILNLIAAKKKAQKKLPYIRLTYVIQPENMHEQQAFESRWSNVVDRIDFQTLLEINGSDLNSEQSDNHLKNTCVQPFQRLTIDYNGDVYPCCTYYKKYLKLGNIKSQTIEELWNCKKIKDLRQSLREKNHYRPCIKCLDY
jgi:radical SAM protein with 4Fe4S-binding SPASM domain